MKKFYAETYQVTILHTTKDGRKFIVRYGELDGKSITVEKGDNVRQRNILGKTGKLLNNKGLPLVKIGKTVLYMLHFEYYTGANGYDLSTPLTTGDKPFMRRRDLADPINILQEGYRNSFLRKVVSQQNERVSPNLLKTSQKGIDFIVSWEKRYLTAYDDSENYATIGYGHLVDYRKCEEIRKDTKRKWPIRGVTKEEFLNGISDERAKELFVSDLKKTELAVLQSIKVPLFQP